MAMAVRYRCDRCDRAVVAWDEGNPYYIDEAGRKRHAYHPQHELVNRCIGNDVPHLCLHCGAETTVDSRRPRTKCRKCKAEALVDTWELEGKGCPCGGSFRKDPEFFAVS